MHFQNNNIRDYLMQNDKKLLGIKERFLDKS
jgi:hypothetical protein